jgi:ADP-ribose pyrophosphatase
LPRRLIESTRVFKGLIFDVDRDRLIEADGRETVREVVRHPGGAGGLPVFADGRVALVRQYRHPAGRELLEIPAGRIEEGESPDECARREIEAETGARPGRMEKLAEFYSTPGFCEEKLYIFLATGLETTRQDLDEDEAVDVVYLTLDEAIALAKKGEIEDSKTLVALLLAESRLKAAQHTKESRFDG